MLWNPPLESPPTTGSAGFGSQRMTSSAGPLAASLISTTDSQCALAFSGSPRTCRRGRWLTSDQSCSLSHAVWTSSHRASYVLSIGSGEIINRPLTLVDAGKPQVGDLVESLEGLASSDGLAV